VSAAASATKTTRLISWNVDIMSKLLKQIAVRRKALGTDKVVFLDPEDSYGYNQMVLEEVKEIITLPRFNKSLINNLDDTKVEMDTEVVEQLRHFVTTISSLYR
jgi:hypothetical protein